MFIVSPREPHNAGGVRYYLYGLSAQEELNKTVDLIF